LRRSQRTRNHCLRLRPAPNRHRSSTHSMQPSSCWSASAITRCIATLSYDKLIVGLNFFLDHTRSNVIVTDLYHRPEQLVSVRAIYVNDSGKAVSGCAYPVGVNAATSFYDYVGFERPRMERCNSSSVRLIRRAILDGLFVTMTLTAVTTSTVKPQVGSIARRRMTRNLGSWTRRCI
jgi:hypothetical protein